MRCFMAIIPVALVLLSVNTGYCQLVGPFVNIFNDYVHEKDQPIQKDDSVTNETSNDVRVTFFQGQELEEEWSIEGGGQAGAVVAQYKWGLSIGFSDTETWSIETENTIPPKYEISCGCPPAGIPMTFGWICFEHRFVATHREKTERSSKYSYYYYHYETYNEIRDPSVKGWAKKKEFPSSRIHVCELAHYTDCWPTEQFQNPFTHDILTYYYTPINAQYMSQLNSVLNVSPNQSARSCVAPE